MGRSEKAAPHHFQVTATGSGIGIFLGVQEYFNLKTSPSGFQFSKQLPLAETKQERFGLK